MELNQNQLVKRSFTQFNFIQEDEGTGIIEGVPIVFDQATDIGGWYEEKISRKAVKKKALENVRLHFDHRTSDMPLARTENGRLSFDIKEDGVHMKAQVNLNRSDAKDLYLAVQDGDISGMSFMFRVTGESWDGLDTDYPTRTITEIGEIVEVSAVTNPAYPGTSIDARGKDSGYDALLSAREKAKPKAELPADVRAILKTY